MQRMDRPVQVPDQITDPPAPLVLASRSPRRRALLTVLGIPFQEKPSDADERLLPDESPRDAVQRLALVKAEAAARDAGGALVLAADLLVVHEGRPLGKPKSKGQAREMLRSLRARPHQVITGVALLAAGGVRRYLGLQETEVWMRDYTDDEIEAYLARGEAMDKAGAYAIQDQQLSPVAHLRGCYPNVAGLPLCEVVRAMEALGHPLADMARGPFVPPCRLCREGARVVGEPRVGRLYADGQRHPF